MAVSREVPACMRGLGAYLNEQKHILAAMCRMRACLGKHVSEGDVLACKMSAEATYDCVSAYVTWRLRQAALAAQGRRRQGR